jgi:hypothetical protein
LNNSIESFLKLAGLLQIVLSLGSLAIPRILKWKIELRKVPKLMSQMFWTYAAYILVINLSFGLISLFGVQEMMAKTFLAKALSVFIFLYWFARVLIQFFYFDTKSAPKGTIYKLGEIGLITIFIFLAVVYCWLTFLNFT